MDENIVNLLKRQQRKLHEWLFLESNEESEFVVNLELRDKEGNPKKDTSIVINSKRVLDEILEGKDPFDKSVSILLMKLYQDRNEP